MDVLLDITADDRLESAVDRPGYNLLESALTSITSSSRNLGTLQKIERAQTGRM